MKRWLVFVFAGMGLFRTEFTQAQSGAPGLIPAVSDATLPQGTIELPVLGTVSLDNFLLNTQASFCMDQHGTKWGGASLPLAWYPKDPGLKVLTLNPGVLWETGSGKPSGLFVSLGIRTDTLISNTTIGQAVSQKLGLAKIPTIEFGPFGGYVTAQKTWLYGLFAARRVF